jgi:hypothetical protein
MDMRGKLHVRRSTLRKSPRYPLDRRLGWLQNRPGCCGDEKNLAVPRNNTGRRTCNSWLYRLIYPDSQVRPSDIMKLINSLKLRKTCGIDRIPNEWLRHLPRRPLVHLTHLLTTAFSCRTLQNLGRKRKSKPYRNPVRCPDFLKIYAR